jgi:hypothetical protein
MDYDVVFTDERNAVRVSDNRRPVFGTGGYVRPGSRTVVVPPGARPTVITGGGSSSGYIRPGVITQTGYSPQGYVTPQGYMPPQGYMVPSDPYSFASRFGMTTGELIDAGIQILAAIQSLPAAPLAQGEVTTDVENMLTYQTALWQHAKRDEQLRTVGGLLARILR